jgi:hypothetical protein
MSHIASSLLAKRRREQRATTLQASPSHDAMRRLELAINEADVACATLQDSLDNSLLDDTLHVNLSSTDIFGTRCVCCVVVFLSSSLSCIVHVLFSVAAAATAAAAVGFQLGITRRTRMVRVNFGSLFLQTTRVNCFIVTCAWVCWKFL